ncbi:hypothetical protein [Luteolibacter soli]|uniref:hypothetical protein n=1 Tax=Luteolibacter soli TaxID=3135280 RepID=UPI003119C32F
MIAILLLALMWKGWRWYGYWRDAIRLTFPDGSPAEFAQISIWVGGESQPINHRGGWLAVGKSVWPPTADKGGVYRLNRVRADDPAGLYIVANAWKDGREHAAWVRLESAKEASWPVRLTLNPIR